MIISGDSPGNRSRHVAAISLPAVFVEISGVEPGFKGALSCRPFVVEHRKPRRVAIAVFDDQVLAEDAFEGESQT